MSDNNHNNIFIYIYIYIETFPIGSSLLAIPCCSGGVGDCQRGSRAPEEHKHICFNTTGVLHGQEITCLLRNQHIQPSLRTF